MWWISERETKKLVKTSGSRDVGEAGVSKALEILLLQSYKYILLQDGLIVVREPTDIRARNGMSRNPGSQPLCP